MMALQWADTACYKINGARLHEYDTVHIGKQATPHTHVLAYHRFVLYCLKCGCYATHKHLIKLAKQREPITPHGSHCPQAFRQDRCPPGLGRWPAGGGAITNIGPAKTGQSIGIVRGRPARATASSHEMLAVPARLNVDSSINPRPQTTPKPAPPPLQFNLRELLELESGGERVVWPSGFDATVATAYIENYNLAVGIGRLYAQTIETAIEESTLTHVVSPPILEAESQEPGPLPLVSGNQRSVITRTALTPNIRPRRRCITLREYESRPQFSVPVTGAQNAPLHHCASAGASSSSSAGPVIPEVLDPLDDPDLSMEEDWTYFALGAIGCQFGARHGPNPILKVAKSNLRSLWSYLRGSAHRKGTKMFAPHSIPHGEQKWWLHFGSIWHHLADVWAPLAPFGSKTCIQAVNYR